MHYQPKERQVYRKSLLHGRTSVYEEYIECSLVFVIGVPKFQKTNSGSFRKTKNSACNNWSKILRPNLSEKLSGEHFEKKSIKTVITYNNIFLCQITVYLENSRLWDQIWPKERMMKILRNRHWIHNQHNESNSCASHLICRIINFGSKSAQKLLWGGALRQRNQKITCF